MFFVVLAVIGLVVIAGLLALFFSSRTVEVVALKPPPPGVPQVKPTVEAARDVINDAVLQELVRHGRKIEAIKRYRELSGVGLREAKEAVDALSRQVAGAHPLPTHGVLPAKAAVLREVADADIEAQIRAGLLIDAIKLYREKTGVGLKEAKDAVEAWRDRMRAS